jgi:hypothetical protein
MREGRLMFDVSVVLCSLFLPAFRVDDCRLCHPKGEVRHIFLRSLRPVLLFCSAMRNSIMLCLFVPQITNIHNSFIFIFEVSQPPTDDTDSIVTACTDCCVKL